MEKSYWKTGRTIDTELDKLQTALEVKDNKDDNSDSTERRKMSKWFIQVVFQFILFSYLNPIRSKLFLPFKGPRGDL